MAQWYLSYDGQQAGPMELEQARIQAAAHPGAHAWRDGLPSWQPVAEIAELRGSPMTTPNRAPEPVPPVAASSRPTLADEVDYIVYGHEMQFVEIELDPGESAVAEAGAMMYKDPAIRLETIFGDGSRDSSSGGFMGKLLGAGKRLLTGENLFMTVFTHAGSHGKARVAFAAPYPGNIVPVSLAKIGGRLICQKDSFLCAARGVSIGIHFQRRILTGLFGGEGFIMQKLEGDGLVFVHAGGTLMERELKAGETLHVDRPASNLILRWSAALNRRCSAARACFSPLCAAPATSGCNPCRSRGWPGGCWHQRPAAVARFATKVRY